MPAPNELVWYKWFPAKALTSLRWLSLTASQEGYYRRLYDWAALAQPSSRRGFLYEHNVPATLAQVAQAGRFRGANDAQTFLKCMIDKGLMCQDENGAWGFPNFAKHQRTSMLRVRADGLGSAETGLESAQNRRRIGAIEAEAEAEADVPPTPQVRDGASASISSDLQKSLDLTFGFSDHRYALDWLTLWPEPWIMAALVVTREKKGARPGFTRSVLQRYQQQGVPDGAARAGKDDGAEEPKSQYRRLA